MTRGAKCAESFSVRCERRKFPSGEPNMETEEVYTKLEYEQDMLHCGELLNEARRCAAHHDLDGFELLAHERKIFAFRETCKKRWARSQGLLGALRANRVKLTRAVHAEEIDRLTRKVNYLKLLASRILAGSERMPESEPEKPVKWPWVRMINGWQRVEERD